MIDFTDLCQFHNILRLYYVWLYVQFFNRNYGTNKFARGADDKQKDFLLELKIANANKKFITMFIPPKLRNLYYRSKLNYSDKQQEDKLTNKPNLLKN